MLTIMPGSIWVSTLFWVIHRTHWHLWTTRSNQRCKQNKWNSIQLYWCVDRDLWGGSLKMRAKKIKSSPDEFFFFYKFFSQVNPPFDLNRLQQRGNQLCACQKASLDCWGVEKNIDQLWLKRLVVRGISPWVVPIYSSDMFQTQRCCASGNTGKRILISCPLCHKYEIKLK